MRWRVVAWISLGVNIALAAGLLLSGRRSPGNSPSNSPVSVGPSPDPVKTNVLLRRQFFSWREVESDDYPTYIANLHDIGCPAQTIRDIIIADVNSLYSRRRSLEILTPEQQWWRPEPDSNVVQVASEKAKALDEERRG